MDTTTRSRMQEAILAHHAWSRQETISAVYLLSEYESDFLPTGVDQVEAVLGELEHGGLVRRIDAEVNRFALTETGGRVREQILAARPSTRNSDLGDADSRARYAAYLVSVPDHEIVAMVESEVAYAAILGGMRAPSTDGRHDRACALLYAECVRRGNPGLYEHGDERARCN